MAEMKPSGLPAIGYIPIDWETKPLKYCVNINKEVILESTRPDYSFRYVDIGSVTYIDGITGYDDTTFENAPSRARRIVHKGDTIVSTVRTYLKAIARIQDDKDVIVSTGFAVLSPYSMDSIFLEYFCKSESFGEEVDRQSTGIAYPAVSASQIGRIYAPLPPLPEQQAIAAFLDDRCGQVDSIIADLTQQTEILRQYKKALITETVTKGLNKSAPMKDSGIEWIGTLPAHWTISKLRYLANVCSGATPSKDVLAYWDGDIPWISSMEVKTDIIEDTSLHISPEAVKSCSTKILPIGTPVMVVRSGILQHTLPIALTGVPATINQDVKAFFFNSQIKPAYFKYYVQGLNDYLLTALCKEKSTVENIDGNLLLSCPIPLPSIVEQEAIIDRLDAQIGEVNKIVTEKERSIETMRQYKKSLIYEYVTGKKRVAG